MTPDRQAELRAKFEALWDQANPDWPLEWQGDIPFGDATAEDAYNFYRDGWLAGHAAASEPTPQAKRTAELRIIATKMSRYCTRRRSGNSIPVRSVNEAGELFLQCLDALDAERADVERLERHAQKLQHHNDNLMQALKDKGLHQAWIDGYSAAVDCAKSVRILVAGEDIQVAKGHVIDTLERSLAALSRDPRRAIAPDQHDEGCPVVAGEGE